MVGSQLAYLFCAFDLASSSYQEEDESRKKRPGRRYASYDPEIDNAIMAMEFWNERWLAHPLRNKFRTLKDFISWSMSNEDQPFKRGGIVSML